MQSIVLLESTKGKVIKSYRFPANLPLRPLLKIFILAAIVVWQGIFVGRLTLESYKKCAYKMVLVQVVIAFCASLVACYIAGASAAEALLVGSAIYIVPGACYAAQLFDNLSSHAVKRIIVVFYIGELLKFVASVGAFVVIFKLFSLPLVPYFSGYIIAAVSFCVAPLFVMPTPKSKRATY